MPDWSYHPIFKPLLFALAPERARRWTLRAIGAVGRAPGGAFLIRTLGHMETPPEMSATVSGLRFDCPVGLGGEVDPHGEARTALSQFGFGYLEIGPISERKTPPATLGRETAARSIHTTDRFANDGVERIERTLRRDRRRGLRNKPLFLRLRHDAGAEPEEAAAQYARLAARLAPYSAALVVDACDERWPEPERSASLRRALEAVRAAAPGKFLLLYVSPDAPDEALDAYADEALARWDGLVVGGAVGDASGGWRFGAAALAASRRAVARLRDRLPRPFPIVAAGGVVEPKDAVDLRRDGADLIELNAGLVFAGPGLAKRANEALLYDTIQSAPAPEPPSFWSGWGWMLLLGVGMLLGGVIAWLLAATVVVLPYDTRFLGIDHAALHRLNERLLPFMSHDRMTLAGTMVSIGVLYVGLAGWGMRRRLHWARMAAMTSGLVGFSGFFLYLGYGYFDLLHAAVSALLLPMFILAMRDGRDEPSRRKPNDSNDARWRRALYGQLAFVAVGVGLTVGGLTIAGVGVTRVFVPSDLAFLGTLVPHLHEANPRLVPVIAHDRAGFGGALVSDGLAVLMTALWGLQQGEKWIWRMLLLAGLPGFAAGLGIHWSIGYTDFLHLLPVYALAFLYLIGLVLLYPYLHARDEASVTTAAASESSR
jgi:dihydroorotate dehydrogenase